MLTIRYRGMLTGLVLKKEYVFFAILYGLSSLLVPLTTQYLVNKLALSGIFINTLALIIIFGICLVAAQIFKFSQVILNEYLQREIFISLSSRWMKTDKPEKSHYYFEVMNVMKSFSTSFGHLVELVLLLLFGFMVIVSFHPAFLILPLILGGAIYFKFSLWERAVETSIKESDEKYRLHGLKSQGQIFSDEDLDEYLSSRNVHFFFIKRNKILVSVTNILSQLFLIGVGIYLIQIQELSIGQLVSAEIILAGILASLSKFPKTMEDLYDFETSMIKLETAVKGSP